MGIVVQKFGGSSVADAERLLKVCKHIIKEHNEGNNVAVVVSAQGKTTDKLISEEREITKNPNKREHDTLVSVGEQITISKLAMTLEELGYKAISLTGWQVPIVTTNEHGNAKIKYINNEKILDLFNKGYIVIIAGFQGVSEELDITTFGRGGSDTTAVAVAASLKADKCEIFTDVDGVFSSDPRIVKNVKKIDNICYDEMLELSSMGAKVLHNRCVEIGKKYNLPIIVKSTFEESSRGTIVDNNYMENITISGVTKDTNVARITVMGLENKIGRTYNVFKLLADNNINVDVIVQSFGENVNKNLSFSIKTSDLESAVKLLNDNIENIGAREIRYFDNLSKISIIGIGIANKTGVAADMFEALYENDINMHLISTSEIKISVLVDREESDRAVRAIHQKFFNN
ncbi:MAG: aspartate kinase [Clostridia bacterium]|nr:aspartate kinase [Clostridia bacterium]